MTPEPLRAPFVWFGGKSRAAPAIWRRFGNTPNYVEPFAGSLAVLLARPHGGGIGLETVNDKDAYLCNFWRALQADPAGVERWADWPVNEIDLHARHRWLIESGKGRVAHLRTDPDYFDVQVAGWWLWGLRAWIGRGWCSALANQIPNLRGESGVTDALLARLAALSDRLRYVRVTCGEWDRVLGPSVTTGNGLTAVLLDPPYAHAERDPKLYAVEDDVSADVRAWAVANGDNPELRIALCGYDGEHDMPAGWTRVRWKAVGGRGNWAENRAKANAHRETVWFSRYCLHSGDMFDAPEVEEAD